MGQKSVLGKNGLNLTEIKSAKILIRLLIFFPSVTQSDYSVPPDTVGPVSTLCGGI